MTDRQYAAIIAALAFVLLAVIGSTVFDIETNQRRDHILLTSLLTDHRTMAALQTELTKVKADQHETEVALDREAIENLRLRDEIRVLKLNEDISRKMHSL